MTSRSGALLSPLQIMKLRCRVVLVAVAVFVAPSAAVIFAQSGLSKQQGIKVEGTVRNIAGMPVAGVSVHLQAAGDEKFTETKTDAGGNFVVWARQPGSYLVTAEKAGWRTTRTPSLMLSMTEKKHLDLILERSDDGASSRTASPGASDSGPMQFRDEPTFVVAGVTDGSNMGGHGSDSSRRTSDALARDTVALKAAGASGVSTSVPGSSAPEMESKLHKTLLDNPGSFRANQELGDFYFRSQRYREAIPLLEAAYQMRADDFANAYNLALAYQANGELARAREHVRKMLAGSGKPDLHRLLGDLDERLDDPLGAVYEYEQAARLDPSVQNYFSWGTELLLHRATQAAIEVFNKGVTAHRGSARMLIGLGAALYANGSYDEAAKRLCAASDLSPNDAAPYAFLGKMMKAASAPLPCAEEKLARFVQEQPGNALAHYYYAMALWKKGRGLQDTAELQRITELLNRAVKIDHKFGEAYLQLGTIATEQGKLQQAIDAFKQAIEANGQLAEAHYRLGLAYKQDGEATKAQQEFELYNQISKDESAAVERERRELRQYLITLKDQRSAVH
jgi:tetratricopeptide (TPR) repeat protein